MWWWMGDEIWLDLSQDVGVIIGDGLVVGGKKDLQSCVMTEDEVGIGATASKFFP